MSKASREWSHVIRPKSGLFELPFGELWRYRDLILLLVRRDFVATYKQTVLGPLWFLLQPLLTTLIFTIVFGRIAGIETEGLPHMLFFMSGVVLWRYFADCVTKTSTTFTSNAAIFGKVYFPRLTVPVSVVISSLFSYGLQLLLFAGFVVYYAATEGVAVQPLGAIVLTLPLTAVMGMLGLGIGILVSSMTAKYRDLRFLIGFGVQLMMYLTPVVYPLSAVPEHYRHLALLNPMCPLIEGFRNVLFGVGTLSWPHVGYSVAVAVCTLLLGVLFFGKIEQTFMDTV